MSPGNTNNTRDTGNIVSDHDNAGSIDFLIALVSLVILVKLARLMKLVSLNLVMNLLDWVHW